MSPTALPSLIGGVVRHVIPLSAVVSKWTRQPSSSVELPQRMVAVGEFDRVVLDRTEDAVGQRRGLGPGPRRRRGSASSSPAIAPATGRPYRKEAAGRRKDGTGRGSSTARAVPVGVDASGDLDGRRPASSPPGAKARSPRPGPPRPCRRTRPRRARFDVSAIVEAWHWAKGASAKMSSLRTTAGGPRGSRHPPKSDRQDVPRPPDDNGPTEASQGSSPTPTTTVDRMRTTIPATTSRRVGFPVPFHSWK